MLAICSSTYLMAISQYVPRTVKGHWEHFDVQPVSVLANLAKKGEQTTSRV